jgi:3-phenylpropionate/cinnamic acid dioxygenase small subunit
MAPPDPATDRSTLRARAQRLEDEREIRELLTRLVQLSDQRRFEDYVALFTDDATFEIVGQSLERGIAEIRAATRARWDATPGGIGRHLLTNFIVEVEGDSARARSYITIVGRGDGEPRIAGMGAYEDMLMRTPAGWRLKTHVIRSESPPETGR